MIEISNLSYAYPSLHSPETAGENPSLPPGSTPEWVLRDISLSIPAGEFTAIMGPTGVGKTTLCLAFNGIVPHLTGGTMRGDVFIDGKNTKQSRVPELARSVGMVFQEPESQLFNASVEDEVAFGLENLGLPPQEMRERVEWSLSVVNMSEHRLHSPAHLSGGQQKRVAIASVLAMLPSVIVLDEPTANLDPRGVAEIFPVLQKLTSQNISVIMASHESEALAEFCHHVVVLAEGSVALDGEPGEVFSQVSRLHEIGLDVPQVSELAVQINQAKATQYKFYQLEPARRTLTQSLGAGPR